MVNKRPMTKVLDTIIVLRKRLDRLEVLAKIADARTGKVERRKPKAAKKRR